MSRKPFILLLVLFITASTSFTVIGLPEEFSKLLERNKMSFTLPDGYKEVPVIENRQMNYEYAIKHKDKNFEVRYAIRPLDNEIKSYNEWQKTKGPNDVRINPNNLYESLFSVTVLNISGGQLPEYDTFPPEAVKQEFGADWGAVVLTEAGEEFGQKYKYCMTVGLHKHDVGDAYYFYLFDDREVMDELMMTAFHSLRFK